MSDFDAIRAKRRRSTKILAMLINPREHTIIPVYYPCEDIDAMYGYIECDCFDAVSAVLFDDDLNEHAVTLWVDDAGALKEHHAVYIFAKQGDLHLAGNVLVTGGVGPEGETLGLPSAVSVQLLGRRVSWTSEPVIPRISFVSNPILKFHDE
jgi:hypothetical protein